MQAAAAAAARVQLQQLIPHSPIRDATEWVGVGGERERGSLEVSGVVRQVEWNSVKEKKRLQQFLYPVCFFTPTLLL